MFGSNTSSGSSLFGSNTLFGNAAPTTNQPSLFGGSFNSSSNPTSSIFGNSTFNQSGGSNLFGQSTMNTPFGQNPTTNNFNQPNNTFTQASNTFNPQPTNSFNIQPTNTFSQPTNTFAQSNQGTGLPFGNTFGRPTTSTPPAMFGNQQAGTSFSSPAGNTSLFGNTATSQQSNLFGNNPPTFGQTLVNQAPQSSSSLFGNNLGGSSTSLFGTTQQPSSVPTTSMFGMGQQSTGSSLFGNSQPQNMSSATPFGNFQMLSQPSLFGNTQPLSSPSTSFGSTQPIASFSSSLFNSGTTQATPAQFGSSNTMQTPQFGNTNQSTITSLFGNTQGSALGSNTGSLFNFSQSTTSSFGTSSISFSVPSTQLSSFPSIRLPYTTVNTEIGSLTSPGPSLPTSFGNLQTSMASISPFGNSTGLSTSPGNFMNAFQTTKPGLGQNLGGSLNILGNIGSGQPQQLLGSNNPSNLLFDSNSGIQPLSAGSSYLPLDPTVEQVANFYPDLKVQFEKIEETMLDQEKHMKMLKEEFEPLKSLNEGVQQLYENELSTVQAIDCINQHIDYAHTKKIRSQISWAKQTTSQIQKIHQQLLYNKEFLEQEQHPSLTSRSKELSVHPIQIPTPLTPRFYQDMIELVSFCTQDINTLKDNVEILIQKTTTHPSCLSIIKQVIDHHCTILKMQSDKLLMLKKALEVARSLLEKRGFQLPPFENSNNSLFTNTA